ncbi:MAG: sigma-70 family RNA polymerase sigma factor [Acidobacteria bacterium]|nr:sigma-70 family RNA polymerase sigma factor [Acidobacteriota bacterium]
MEPGRPLARNEHPDGPPNLADGRHDGAYLEGFDPTDIRFDDLFRCYKHMVFQLAYRLLGNYDDALELSQDVFCKVYKNLGTFRGESSLRTWIYRITVNLSHNKIRWRKAKRIFGMRDIHTLEPRSVLGLERDGVERMQNPEQRLLEDEDEQRVQRCLQGLPIKLRTVLVLRDIDGMSYEEIAQGVGISVGTVKSRIARGRERLRFLLAKSVFGRVS